MNTNCRYLLETPRITGHRQQKTTCPKCGRKKCFVRYVDTHNNCSYLADNVGKCDHENSCGYHYKPGHFFADTPNWADYVKKSTTPDWTPPPLPPFQPLPMDLVTRSHSPNSFLWQWLSGPCALQLDLDSEVLQRVYEDYQLGATRQGEVIYWQIDELGRVHGGHIMQYGTDGHRLGHQGWVHARLIREGQLPLDWQLYQCLFGQHLLAQRPHAHVCLVESEKTALVMAAHHPELLWLATCGCGGLNAEKVECLRGRRVTLFPDSGCYEKWARQMDHTTGIQYNISSRMEDYPPNTDLCDVLF